MTKDRIAGLEGKFPSKYIKDENQIVTNQEQG